MSSVEVRSVTKRYETVVALDDVSLAFADGEFFGLLGPSGSGKTTLLRAIAGFVQPDAGEIRIAGEPVGGVPVHKRAIGMVFQNYALFPHLNVFDNVAFGLSVRGETRSSITAKVKQSLALVRLSGLEARRPKQLSGGQQQRVALARALVTRPKVLLLDEPLGALDKRLRQEMQVELKAIQREVGITTIFVTHDQEEALTLSDRIAIFNEGRIVQAGAPAVVYERPGSVFAANFLGDANFFSGRIVGSRAEMAVVAVEGGHELLARVDGSVTPGAAVNLAVRPEKIAIMREGRAADGQENGPVNELAGHVAQAVYSGNSISYTVEAAGRRILVFEQNSTARPLTPGESVQLRWPAEHSVMVTP